MTDEQQALHSDYTHFQHAIREALNASQVRPLSYAEGQLLAWCAGMANEFDKDNGGKK